MSEERPRLSNKGTALRCEHDQLILAEQARLLIRSPVPFLANLVNAAIVAAVAWQTEPHAAIVAWFGIMAAVVTVRLLAWLRQRRQPITPETARHLVRVFTVSAGVTGCLWGLAAWVLVQSDIVVLQAFIAFVLAGMAAGATAVNAVYLPAFYAYLAPTILPLATAFLVRGDQIHLAMAFMTALFTVLLIMFGRHLNRSFRDTIELKIEKTELADELDQSRAQLEIQVRERTTELRDRVTDLEAAQRKLERQGEDLVRLADDLRAARDQAEAGNLAKSQFLAAMNHELRTPLNAIIGFSEFLKGQDPASLDGPKFKDYLSQIHSSGDHLRQLIEDILEYSAIDTQVGDLRDDCLPVRGTIEAAVEALGSRAQSGGVAIMLNLADQLPSLSANAYQMKRVLSNLLGNAVKFTARGGEVRLGAGCDAGGDLLIWITDTGIGMTGEEIERAVSPFVQVDGDLNRRYEGTGLGLPLAKGFVEVHGGELRIESQPGCGTTVTVRFPAARVVWGSDSKRQMPGR